MAITSRCRKRTPSRPDVRRWRDATTIRLVVMGRAKTRSPSARQVSAVSCFYRLRLRNLWNVPMAGANRCSQENIMRALIIPALLMSSLSANATIMYRYHDVRNRQQHDSSDTATEKCAPFTSRLTRAAHSTVACWPTAGSSSTSSTYRTTTRFRTRMSLTRRSLIPTGL
jgi:hypothetical protein